MLTGILRLSAGGGRVAGADIRRAGRAIKQCIGYMSQAFSLYIEFTVVDNIQFYAGVYGLGWAQARKRCRWIVVIAGLERLFPVGVPAAHRLDGGVRV